MQKNNLDKRYRLERSICPARIGILFIFIPFFLLLSPHHVYAQETLAGEKINLELKGLSLKEAFLSLQKQSGINFVFSSDFEAYASRKVSISEKDITAQNAIELLLKGTKLQYTWVDDQVVIDEKPAGTQSSGTKSSGPPGTLKGRIVETETSEPLIGATVRILGTDRGTMTDLDGYYSFDKVPAGRHTIEVAYMGYTTQQVNVNIPANRTAAYDVVLSVDSKLLDEVVISGIRRERGSVPHATVGQVTQEIKELKVVASGISSEQISRSADRNAAQAVQRVSGVSIVDDKFVIVRGLNPRYNMTYLNDNVAPSTETNSRSFALDLIPSRVIDKIMVQKSPSPDNLADATGGVIKIYTKEARAVKHLDVDFQLGYREGSSFSKNFMTYSGGGTDFLGFDDGTRALPSAVPTYGDLSKARLLPSETVKAFNHTLAYGRKAALPNIQFTLNYYDAWTVFGRTLSSLTSLSYKNDYAMTHRINQASVGYEAMMSASSVDKMGYEDRSVNTVQTNLLQNFTYRFNDRHVFFFNNFLLQQGDDATVQRDSWSTAYLFMPESQYGAEISRDISLTWSQRFLYAGNLGATHRPGRKDRHTIQWNGGYSYTRYEMPDQRVSRFTGSRQSQTTGDAGLYYVSKGAKRPASGEYTDPIPYALGMISRLWSRSDEAVYNASLDYTFKITPWLSTKAGTFHQWKSRRMDRRVFTVHEGNMSDPDAYAFSSHDVNVYLVRFSQQELHNVWSGDYFRDDYTGLRLFDRTEGADTYRATEQNNSAYWMASFTPPNRLVDLTGGIRYEYNRQKIAAAIPPRSSVGDINLPILVDTPTRSWLPSASLNIRPVEQLVFRAAFGKTVNRTEFREVSPFKELDFTNNTEIVGSPNLLSAKVDNWDLRLEYYPNEGDAISAGVFHKEITNPIERINTTSRSESNFPSVSFHNAASATVKGVEVELRKSFDFIPLPFFRHLSFAGNASWIDSKAKFDEAADYGIVKERPLQGQAPYLVNAGLYWENAAWGSKFGVIYNTAGESIYAVGLGYRYNSYIRGPENRGSLIELPRRLLDISYTQRMGKGLQAKLTVQNILNEAVRIAEDNNFSNKYEPLKEEPVITEIEGANGKYERRDYGDPIYQQYNPGRYVSISISYSF